MDYGSTISKVLPGTFVPDIGAATKLDETPNVGPIPGGPAAAGESGGTSFKDTVKAMLDGVNDKVNASDQATRDLADGKTNDLQKVVTSVEEANLALNFTMAMRSKLLDAYTEISRMQV
ncbi:MAG TPA: flagellar hook-basal body complex protein FliE [Candidatus Elarobacter sp.]|jgi:flagellar hook-basal body complex protein FliE|nr:flagellar hook-basal body complex protein FliE [Candidatus Elarobacter sp.]